MTDHKHRGLTVSLANNSGKWFALAPPILIMLLGMAIYSNTFPGCFFPDDIKIVVNNHLIQSLDIRSIFTSDYWGPGAGTGLFRPVTILSYALNNLVLGHEPWSYHLVNVLLHGVISALLYILLRSWGLSVGRSWLAAALFAVHPIHTEVINEVVGRAELLVALFVLAGLWFARFESPIAAVGVCCCYLAALLSKEHAITFCCLLLLADLFLRRDIRRRLPLYTGILFITVAYLVHWYFIDRSHVTQGGMSLQMEALYSPMRAMSNFERVLTALKIQVLYLSKLFVPIRLQGVYSGKSVATPVVSLFTPWGGVILLVLAVLVILTLYGWRRRQTYGLAILLYVVSFAVTSNIFFPTEVAMAERFTYLPSLWFFMAVSSALPGLQSISLKIKNVKLSLAIIILLLLAMLTLARNGDYSSQPRLWSLDFNHDPGNVLAGIFLISADVHKGDYDQAEEVCRTILSRYPDLPEIQEDLAWILMRQGRSQESIKHGLRAVRLWRGAPPSDKVLLTLAEGYGKLGRSPREALFWLDQVTPGSQTGFYWELRGNAFEHLGHLQDAVECYYRAGEPPPESDLPLRLEQVLRRLGETYKADQIRQWRLERNKAYGLTGR